MIVIYSLIVRANKHTGCTLGVNTAASHRSPPIREVLRDRLPKERMRGGCIQRL